MADIKTKLLTALDGTSFDAVETELLVDILADKVRRLEAEIARIVGVNAREKQGLIDAQEAIRRDMQRLRSDPLFGAHGYYRFDRSVDEHIIIECAGGEILRVYVRQHGVDVVCHQMPMEAP